jgi:hypothetical protein
MSMPACRFTFDDTPAFDGFDHGSTWNGFDNVAVSPEVRDQIVRYFRTHDDRDTAQEIALIEPMKDTGLISLGWGFTTHIVRPYARKPADAIVIAGRFVTVLQSWLKPHEWQEMCRLNALETNPLICHSHDFCDANMAMCEAFESVTGTTPLADDEILTSLWNDAWALAMPALGGKKP